MNVWTPAADGRKRPVMFYSHGGGFTTGSGGAAYQDGGNLAATWDVVVVATNHRLGLVGYLYLGELGGEEYSTSGNQGMLDFAMALNYSSKSTLNAGMAIEMPGGTPMQHWLAEEGPKGAGNDGGYLVPG